jgi:hypothetical protein
MSDIALELKLPETAFEALEKKAKETHKTVSQLVTEVTLNYLERETRLAAGRAMLRALPKQGAKKADAAPKDLAEKHDEYLSKAAR